MQTLLNADLQNQIREFLAPMKEKVTLVLFTQESPCETCTETRQLLKEISSLNDKITFDEKDLYEDIRETDLYGITLTPSFVMLDSEGQYRGVKFNGIPLTSDNYAKAGEMTGLCKEDWKMYQMADWDWMDKDGAVISRVPGKAIWQAAMRKYCDLGCQRPRGQVQFTGIAGH